LSACRETFAIDNILHRWPAVSAWTDHTAFHRLSVILNDEVQPRGFTMRSIFFVSLAMSGFGMPDLASAQTAISQYPFCIQGVDNPGWSGCSFNTLQACQAAASGTEAECLTNPWYSAGGVGPSTPDGNSFNPNGPIVVGPPPPGN
jgi:Protein of unknown function (DUF3551)